MDKEELLSRMTDTGLQQETLDVILNTLLNTGQFSVRKFALPNDKIPKNVLNEKPQEDYLYSQQIIVFKAIVKKIKQVGIEKFKKYGLNAYNYEKIASLTDKEIYDWLKDGVLPKGDRMILDLLLILLKMSSPNNEFGSHSIDLFEEKEQETKFVQKKEQSVKYTKRIYLNIPMNNKIIEFVTIFKLKCIEKGIPSKMKGMGSSGYEEGELDTTIIYSNDYYFMDHINIIEEIIKERPDLVNDFGSPVISGARVTSKNGECYYSVSSGILADGTSNDYYNRLYKIAFIYLCSQYLNVENKMNIPTLCSLRMPELKAYIKQLFDLLDENTKKKIVEDGHFKQIVCQVSSYLRFGDFNHLEVPLYQDSIFMNYALSDAARMMKEEEERELYLYQTEKLIDNVLELYKQGDFSFDQLMENYLKRISMIYKKYRYYALREKGFVLSDRYKKMSELFRKLLTGYEPPEKLEGYEKEEYYRSIQSGIIEYLNSNGKKYE